MEEAKEFFKKQQDDFRIEIPESLLVNTLNCIIALRPYYNLYNDEDKEIIDAIHSLEEELHWNVLGIEGE